MYIDKRFIAVANEYQACIPNEVIAAKLFNRTGTKKKKCT